MRTTLHVEDYATLDVMRLMEKLQPGRLAKLMLAPMKQFWASHVAALPRRGASGPGGFWEGSARDIMRRSRTEGSAVVLEGVGPADRPGLRMRYLGTQAALGGPLRPRNKKVLVFGVTPESYGKTPYDFGWRPGVRDKAVSLRLRGLFAHAKEVTQAPNPDVLPSDDEFAGVALGVITREVRR